MKDVWYFAYGSNLSTKQKEDRTGAVREARLARLDGYRIAFNKRGGDGTGKANIVLHQGRVVWGVAYRCSPEALDTMDRYEGVQGGHYFRKHVRVRFESGDEIDAVTYVAGGSFINDSLRPSKEYLNAILDGARQHGLPEDYIREIESAAHRR